jgi:hypothetical protein
MKSRIILKHHILRRKLLMRSGLCLLLDPEDDGSDR